MCAQFNSTVCVCVIVLHNNIWFFANIWFVLKLLFFLPVAARMQHTDSHKIRFHAKCSLHTNQFWFLSYDQFFFMLFSLFI